MATEHDMTSVNVEPLRFMLAGRNVDNFWRKVRKSESCWLWTGGRNKDGYGRFAITTGFRPGASIPPQIHVVAHRVSYALATGLWPKMFILHSCDTPACVNPAHLREGTQSENIQEAFDKGRKFATNALPAELVDDIRDFYYDGCHPRHIAVLCGVSLSSVYIWTSDIEQNTALSDDEIEPYESEWGYRRGSHRKIGAVARQRLKRLTQGRP